MHELASAEPKVDSPVAAADDQEPDEKRETSPIQASVTNDWRVMEAAVEEMHKWFDSVTATQDKSGDKGKGKAVEQGEDGDEAEPAKDEDAPAAGAAEAADDDEAEEEKLLDDRADDEDPGKETPDAELACHEYDADVLLEFGHFRDMLQDIAHWMKQQEPAVAEAEDETDVSRVRLILHAIRRRLGFMGYCASNTHVDPCAYFPLLRMHASVKKKRAWKLLVEVFPAAEEEASDVEDDDEEESAEPVDRPEKCNIVISAFQALTHTQHTSRVVDGERVVYPAFSMYLTDLLQLAPHAEDMYFTFKTPLHDGVDSDVGTCMYDHGTLTALGFSERAGKEMAIAPFRPSFRILRRRCATDKISLALLHASSKLGERERTERSTAASSSSAASGAQTAVTFERTVSTKLSASKSAAPRYLFPDPKDVRPPPLLLTVEAEIDKDDVGDWMARFRDVVESVDEVTESMEAQYKVMEHNTAILESFAAVKISQK